MLSYMLPTVEENSKNVRNLSLNLNLQNTTQSQTSSDTDQEQPEELEDADENTKLLNIERQDYVPTTKFNRNGNLIKNGGSKINYKMNITTNGILSNNNDLINNHNSINNNNNSIIKNGDSKDEAETDSVAMSITNENSVNNNNNNDETNSSNNGDNKKIIKMTKLGSKNVTLKR